MVSFRNVVCAAVVTLSVQTAGYSPTAKCDWTGCKYETGLVSQDAGTGKIFEPKPDQIPALINTLTQKSQALQPVAASITIVNGPLIIAGLGPFPQVITGLVDIVSTAVSGISSVENSPPVANVDQADLIFDAFNGFVRVHQQLLSILIGKAGLFTTVPFIGAPVAAVLRQVENVVDTLAFLIIDVAKSRSTELQALASSLGRTIDTAISAYTIL